MSAAPDEGVDGGDARRGAGDAAGAGGGGGATRGDAAVPAHAADGGSVGAAGATNAAGAASSTAAVRVRGLAVRLGGRLVLQDVDAAVAPGTVTAVVGPNASGKSTLLRAIAGLVPAASGSIDVGGDPPGRLRGRRLAARLAWVPARPSVALPFTVREVVAMGRHALPADRAAVEGAIAAMDLEDVRDRPWPQLSTGQQQRVAIARGLAQRAGQPPGVLLLDEPAGPLDLRHADRLGAVVRAEAAAGSAVLLAIHDLGRAADWADAAWVLDRGRLVAAGPVRSALDPPRIADVFGVGARWVRLEGRDHLLAGGVGAGEAAGAAGAGTVEAAGGRRRPGAGLAPGAAAAGPEPRPRRAGGSSAAGRAGESPPA